MKKSIKVLLTTVALTIACVTPVFATETDFNAEVRLVNGKNAEIASAVGTIVGFDNNCGQDAKVAIHDLVDVIDRNRVRGINDEQLNYINYLKGVVVNQTETVRIKQQNIDAITDLGKVNPSFQTQLDAAVVDYNAAVAQRAATEAAIVNAQQTFINQNAGFVNDRDMKATKDADAIK